VLSPGLVSSSSATKGVESAPVPVEESVVDPPEVSVVDSSGASGHEVATLS